MNSFSFKQLFGCVGVLTLVGCAVYGAEAWLGHVEMFSVVARTLVSVTFEAQGLKVGEVILATVLSRHDMVNLDSPLIRRDAA